MSRFAGKRAYDACPLISEPYLLQRRGRRSQPPLPIPYLGRYQATSITHLLQHKDTIAIGTTSILLLHIWAVGHRTGFSCNL